MAALVVTLRAHGDGSILADHRDGREPCLLGLHGWGRDRHDVGSLLDATGHRSVAPDLPGFGASTEPDRAWGAVGYAAVLAEQVAEGGDPPYVVVGHSFGGSCRGVPGGQSPGAGLRAGPHGRFRFCGWARLSDHRSATASSAPPLEPGSCRLNRLEVARQRLGSDDYRAATGVMRDVLVRVVNEGLPG